MVEQRFAQPGQPGTGTSKGLFFRTLFSIQLLFRMKKLAILALLLCLSFSSFAQLFGSKRPDSPLVTHADSVELIHQVFKRTRSFAPLVVLASGVAVGSFADSWGSDRVQKSTFRKSVVIGASASQIALLVSSTVQGIRYSKRREQDAIQRFEQHQPQPRHVERRLAMAYASRR